jgi:hypothetical protein
MLDKELQQIAPQSDTGARTVDKLVDVRLRSGETKWLLIHLEIQSQSKSDFAERMFVYFYRIRDKYNRALVSLAVLADDDEKWRPQRFHEEMFGCRIEFQFPTVKLLDFVDRTDELEQSENHFATVILAHLMTMRTAGNPQDRCKWKLRLLRPMYARGLSSEDVRALFRVIDWMMDLPANIAIVFDSELQKIEQEYHMPYVTSIERRALQQGIEQGIEQGVVAGQIQLLQRLLARPESALVELLKQPLETLRMELASLQLDLASRDRQ